MKREKKIIQTSIIGIITNIALAGFKVVVGLLSNSIAIVLDAVNNLSDALSSIITIIGTKLALKRPDKKHPYGYGRIEYMSALLISGIVLYAGITSVIESIKNIISPETPNYTTITLVIVGVGVIVKYVLGKYVKKVGEDVDSDALVNSGADALNDAIISSTTLIAAIVYIVFHISVEAYLGVGISLVIVKSGLEMLQDTLSRILGERTDGEIVKNIKKTISSFDEVHGAYDLVLHDYGPEHTMASVHIEVDDTLTAKQIDYLTRQIVDQVYMQNHVALTGISVYAKNTDRLEEKEVEKNVRDCVMAHENVIGMHGFYLNEKEREMRFDVVVDLASNDVNEVYKKVIEQVQDMYPDYHLRTTLDVNMSD